MSNSENPEDEARRLRARLAELATESARPPHQPSPPAAPPRKVGFLLGLGIFLLPFVFVWFLLRKGHTAISRVLGFGWLPLALIAAATTNADRTAPPSSPAADAAASAADAAASGADAAASGAADAAAAAAAAAAIDLNDPKVLDDKYGAETNSACDAGTDDYLRSVSKYDFKWDESTHGLFGMKFDKYINHVSTPGVITLISNKVMLQNGFGAYARTTLYCRYDTQSKKVLGYEIEQ